MNREEYDKSLRGIVIPEGTPNEIINEMVQPIREAISEMLPSSLFRCRRCDADSIVAFKSDIIYAGTADKFNDPYDTLVRYDLVALEEGVNRVISAIGLQGRRVFCME